MIVRLVTLCLLLAMAFDACLAAPAPRTPARGAFVDSAGVTHSWSINDSHALIWDKGAYLPVGAVFQSRFLSGVTTEASWRDDLAQLAAYKKHHVMSLLVEPMGPPDCLLETPAEAVQAMIDVLDSEGFTYGFALEGRPTKTWDAALVEPSIYRDPAPPQSATVTFRNIPGLVSANYYLAASRDGSVLNQGTATVSGDTATVNLPTGAGGEGTVLLVYPVTHMTPNTGENRLPDIWSGADDFRDQLLLYFSRIRFGKGLRFFLDPLRVEGPLVATTQGGMIPDDDDFRIRFESWLMTRYQHSRVRLDDSWAIKNQDLTDFAVAARCRPLWFQAKGLASIYDPVTGKIYDAVPIRSNIWTDINEFEIESIQRSMNDIADAVKQGIAGVPVVYRWTQASRVFVNQGQTGFDGLWVDPTTHGANIVSDSAGYAFAAVEQARRAQWLCAGLPGLVDAGSAGSTDGSVDASKSAYKLDRVTLDNIGVKATFVAPPDGAQWSAGEVRWLDWVHSDDLDRNTNTYDFSSDKPGVVFYPTNISLPGASIQSLGQSLWWLPTFQDGEQVDLGQDLEGYKLAGATDTPTFVIYATGTTPVTASFRLSPLVDITAQGAAGMPVPVKDKKGVTSVTFTQSPVIISGAPDLPLPQGAATAEMAEAERLLNAGLQSRVPMDVYSQRLYYIQNNLMNDATQDQRVAYDNIKLVVDQLQSITTPYVWIEGEAATSNSFEGVVASDVASEHAFLWVDSSREPPGGTMGQYRAIYNFSVNAPGTYTVWAAMAPGAPGTTGASPLSLQVDSTSAVDVDRPETAGVAYGTLPFPTPTGARGGFTWCNMGEAALVGGPHTLMISLAGRAPGTDRYTAGIDALVITRAKFYPDGIRKPKF